MKRRNQIGSFRNQFLIEDFTIKFFNWMNTDVVLYFYWCLYFPEEITAKFALSDGIQKKRAIQMKFLEIMAHDSEIYTVDYILNLIKATIPKLYPSLPTLAAFKQNVEAGNFTGCDDQHIVNVALGFADDYFNHRSLGGDRWAISIRDGAPKINASGGEWSPIIRQTPYNPKVDYSKPYQVDMWGFMIDTDSGTYYVNSNGQRVTTPVLEPGRTVMNDPIGSPATEANRLAWNTKMKPINMYGDFDIDPYGYMVSQTDPTVYVTAFGTKTSAKTLVNGLTAPLVPGTNPNPGGGGFSLASLPIIPIALLLGGLVISKIKAKKAAK